MNEVIEIVLGIRMAGNGFIHGRKKVQQFVDLGFGKIYVFLRLVFIQFGKQLD